MSHYLYMSVLPEALIASMLGPEDFGAYYALHHQREARHEAIFFELAPDFRHPFFDIEEGLRRCVPHADGRPKRSVYISVYRVLEHVPMEALRSLHWIGPDGERLELSTSAEFPASRAPLHLYQELAPPSPLVVARLDPVAFFELLVADRSQLVSLPALCFVELDLGELANDPARGSDRNLPYADMPYLRECLVELRQKHYPVKMVYPRSRGSFEYRTLKNGLYIGNQSGLRYFPLPDEFDYRARRFR